MPVRLILTALMLGALSTCASHPGPFSSLACRDNADCPGTEVCFPTQGCADPSQNLVVEVSGDAQSGLYAQDIAVPSLNATQDFELAGPLKVTGEFSRENTAGVDPTNRSAYTEKVFIRATGKSLLIPGVSRSYESTIVDSAPRGLYSMTVGAGAFSFTAIPSELSVPPVSATGVAISRPSDDNVVNFVFPSVKGAVPLAGRLIRQKTASGEVAITTASMTIQVLHPATGLPLSQRASVSSGFAGSRGDFSLMVSPEVKSLTQVVIVAQPVQADAMVPTKSFAMAYPFPQQPVLELGDFGEAWPPLTGQVVDTTGQPVANARVQFTGKVTGDGDFSSGVVLTDGKGQYTVNLLPLRADASYAVTVLPKPGETAGLWVGSMKVDPTDTPHLSVPVIKCQPRTRVTGRVYLPDGVTPAVGVEVIASLKATDSAIPVGDTETTTNEAGVFTLSLDAGVWELTFAPEMMPLSHTSTADASVSGADLPRMTRTLTVKAVLPSDSGNMVSVPEYTLQNGRAVSGTVTSNLGSRSVPVANATLRFFRLTQIEGKDTAILVGTTTADQRGGYTMVIPVR